MPDENTNKTPPADQAAEPLGAADVKALQQEREARG